MTTGNTETGVYNLGGVTNPVNTDISRDPVACAGGWRVGHRQYERVVQGRLLRPGRDRPGRRLLALCDSASTVALADASGDITNPGANVVNFASGEGWSQNGHVTTAGGAGPLSASHYGTFDQDGNVFEWLDTRSGAGNRIIRGGVYDSAFSELQATAVFAALATARSSNYGFRLVTLSDAIVAPATIPEPVQFGGALGGLALLLAWRSRSRRRA